MGSTPASAAITTVKGSFTRFSIPDIARTDNGSSFASQQFADFAKKYVFQQEASSSWYYQSNGVMVRMVRTVKDLLYKPDDP